MLNLVLLEPEIPPNTGNLIRLSANMGASLHLIHPLGFKMDEKSLRRAGLDYRDMTQVIEHESYSVFLSYIKGGRVFACTTKGSCCYADIRYQADDYLLFGPETRGLPNEILTEFDAQSRIRIPMVANSRSLNLANSVSIIAYEAWRQLGFNGGD